MNLFIIGIDSYGFNI